MTNGSVKPKIGLQASSSPRRGGLSARGDQVGIAAPASSVKASTSQWLKPSVAMSRPQPLPKIRMKPDPLVAGALPKGGKTTDRCLPVRARGPAGQFDLLGLHAQLARQGQQYEAALKLRVQVDNGVGALERIQVSPVWLDDLVPVSGGLSALVTKVAADLRQTMQQHPLADFATRTAGLGLLGVASILACTGPLSRFATVSKLWKYLGLSVNTEGRAPTRVRGVQARFSSRGRVICYRVGSAFIKLKTSPYRRLYEQKKRAYLTRERTGPSECPFGHVHVKDRREHDEALGWTRKVGGRDVIPCIRVETIKGKPTVISAHVTAAAQRYAVKCLLRDLWVEWRRVIGPHPTREEYEASLTRATPRLARGVPGTPPAGDRSVAGSVQSDSPCHALTCRPGMVVRR